MTKMDGAILQLHGGGFIFGSSADCGLENRKYAKHTGCPVFSIDY